MHLGGDCCTSPEMETEQARITGTACAVAGCPHYYGRIGSEGIRYFGFPPGEEEAKRWLHLCRRGEDVNVKTARICGAHFLPSDFRQGTVKGTPAKRVLLNGGAVPSVFDCLPQNVRPVVISKRAAPTDRSVAVPAEKRKYNFRFTSTDTQTAVSMKDLEQYDMLMDKLGDAEGTIRDLNEENARIRMEKDILQSEMEKLKEQLHRMEKRLSTQEFRAEKFEESDGAIQKLTGLPGFGLMRSVFQDFLNGHNPEFLNKIDMRKEKGEKYPDRSRKTDGGLKLNYFNQFFLTLLKLRTGMTDEVVGAIFGISQTTSNRYYNTWVGVMKELFGDAFGDWPYVAEFPAQMSTKVYSLYTRIDLIVDCFEIEIQTPQNPDTARKCYSNYKKCYTIKILVGVETDGRVAFLSHAFMGGISDIALVKASGLLERLSEGSLVLADRGFQLADLAKKHGIRWIVPPSAPTGRGCQQADMMDTLKIARARILVERTIGRIKNLKLLEGPLLINTLESFDDVLEVVCHLLKFFPPMFKDLRSVLETPEQDPLTCLPLSDDTESFDLQCFV